MLLDCWSIPCVILLTWIFLKTRYKFKKFAGVAICIAGLVMVVFSDVHSSDRASKYFHAIFIKQFHYSFHFLLRTYTKGKWKFHFDPFQSYTFPSDYFLVLIVSLNSSNLWTFLHCTVSWLLHVSSSFYNIP